MTFPRVLFIIAELTVLTYAETALNHLLTVYTRAILGTQEKSCSRCVACTAISLKFNDYFQGNTSFSAANPPGEEELPFACNFSFLNYRAWQVDGIRFVGLRTVNAQPVPDTESLTEKLKEMCGLFVSLLTVQTLYRLWSNCKKNLFVPLCLSSRPFSSCVGVLSEGKYLKRFLNYRTILYPVEAFMRVLNMVQYDKNEEEEYRVLNYWTSVGNTSSC